MSTAMMSAPSWASLMAWLRPWLRAAPVMKATLPCTRPAIVSSFAAYLTFPLCRLPGPATGAGLLEDGTGAPRQRHAGDVAALVGGEEQHRVADVDRLHPRDRQRVDRLRGRGEVCLGRVLKVRAEQPVGGLVLDHVGVDLGWVDTVHPDHVGGE